MPGISDIDMDGIRSPSPPLPPDPTQHTLRKVQPFQEQYVPPSPQTQPQREVSHGDLKKPNTGRSRAASRAASRAPPVLHQPQPIKDAVNNAFDSSPVAQNQLDPELVRQVTEQVIKNLQQTASMATPTPSVQPQQTQYAAPPSLPVQPAAPSPTQSSTDSIPQRYTPPSPEKRGRREDDSYGSSSPEPIYSDAASTYSRESRGAKAGTQSRETPRPQQQQPDGSAGLRRSNTTGRRRRDVGSDEDRPPRGESGSDSTVRDQSRPYRRDSKDSEASYYTSSSSQSKARRPRVPSDPVAPEEATTLEKIWKPLFDNGNPTMRLSQFLRGLALHLIDDYEPKRSLVVTPAKMMRFFNETKLNDEHYPWEIIFNGKMTAASLSQMYRKLLCQHHLVQVQNHEVPYVPGLTPSGFESFMTCLIQAHPDTEYERLAIAVMNMPISNADDTKERFPKELSRRLLPHRANLHAEQRLVASLNHEPYLVQLRGALNMPPPPPASAPPQQNPFGERERKPYSQTLHSNAIDDEDLGPTLMPIERERKPYTAKEGRGKTYNHESEISRERERDNGRPVTSQLRPDPNPRRNSRSNSGLPPGSFFGNNGSSDPMNIPPPSRHRTSNPPGPPPAMGNGSLPKGGRRATPPPRNPFARSEPVDVNSIPASQYASNLHSNTRDHYAGDPDEDTLRRYHNRRPTNNNGNSAEDDNASGRGYPIPPRPPPSSQAYDSGYGTPGGLPVGSYPRDGLSASNRRSTWYGAVNGQANGGHTANGPGGSDGYGSFAGGNGNGGGYTSQYGASAQH